MKRFAFVVLLLAAAGTAGALPVVFVDNRAPAGGNGTRERPVTTIERALAMATIVYVAESETPYIENVTLKKGQMLIGSAYGLDALRVDDKVDVDVSMPALQGPGPLIRGSISVNGDNIVAGCTISVDRAAVGISASGSTGTLSVRNVWFRTAERAFAIIAQQHHGPLRVRGGSVEATSDGSGISISGGEGDVIFEHFPMRGSFSSVVHISDRTTGTVTLRGGSPIRAEDVSLDAIVVSGIARGASVAFPDRIEIKGRRRGIVASNVAKLEISGAGSTVATTGGAAVDLRDSVIDVTLESVSAEGEALTEGLVLDRVHGKFAVAGGTVRNARDYAVRIAQAENVRLANMTLTASGTNGRLRGAKCAGEFDANTTVPCNAALYLRHLTAGTFENIVVDGGGAMGLNANNIRDVTFEGLHVRGAGDESFEAGALLQEVGGTIRFTLSSFTDNAGSEVTIEQRFNHGRVIFDRCVFNATTRPTAAPRLVDIQVLGAGTLAVSLSDARLNDNAGDGIVLVASGNSSAALTISGSFAQKLGTTAVDVSARGAANVCADLAMNTFLSAGPQAIRLVSLPGSRLQLAGATSSATLSAANRGATATIEAAAPVVTVESCH
jgi:hypothetical protein